MMNFRKSFHNVLIELLLSCCLILSGCATTSENPDPFESFNRGVFAFNKDVDNAFFKPLAEGYKATIAGSVRKGINNFFSNISDIVVVANDLLQLKIQQAGADTGRFLLNSTVGVLGFADVATGYGLPKHYEDFGQTLGYWGLNTGPYLMIPFFGPSSIRDFSGWGVDILFDPRIYYANTDASYFFLATNAVKAVDTRANLLDVERVVDAAALDEYVYIRNAYLQSREYWVKDGNVPKQNDDDLFDDLKQPGAKKPDAKVKETPQPESKNHVPSPQNNPDPLIPKPK